MPPRAYAHFPERKVDAPPKSPKGATGVAPKAVKVTERTAAWPTKGVRGGSGYNRRTKMPVVKQHASQAGLP